MRALTALAAVLLASCGARNELEVDHEAGTGVRFVLSVVEMRGRCSLTSARRDRVTMRLQLTAMAEAGGLPTEVVIDAARIDDGNGHTIGTFSPLPATLPLPTGASRATIEIEKVPLSFEPEERECAVCIFVRPITIVLDLGEHGSVRSSAARPVCDA